MKRLIQIAFVLWIAAVNSAYSQTEGPLQLYLFTDRNWCVSGDTLWFKVAVKEGFENQGNIVHVQLDSPGENLISAAAVKSAGNWAEGFLHVPDSLSTGVYFVSAFLNAQRNLPDVKLYSKSLFVYNRFETEVSEMQVPEIKTETDYADERNIIIVTGKTVYHPRENVTVKFDVSEAGLTDVVVNAAVADPLSSKFGGMILSEMKTEQADHYPTEKDGIVLNGTITDEAGNCAPGVLVLLSITQEVPYFDYCVTDTLGNFRFFLKNAEGVAGIYLQTVSASQRQYQIDVKKNYFPGDKKVEFRQQLLTADERKFIEAAIDGSFFEKIFRVNYNLGKEGFYMPARFSEPFYGEPKERVVPGDFFYLNDFREIARELLRGVQYREKKDEITLRVFNQELFAYFETEPLRLINGVPVFDNNLFKPFDSDDIEYVDFVFRERMFGDLVFNGVLAVSLTDKSNNWLRNQNSIRQFQVNCLQPHKKTSDRQVKMEAGNIPDFRNVFFYEMMLPERMHEIEFQLSDVKGKVEISVQGITKEGKMVKATKLIEVQ